MPEISVVMPAYNASAYIAEAIESILQQDYTDFEFIIINDGSTDNTGEIILSFKDPRIKYYTHETNLGNNISRTEGVTLASGKYIAIMDSDDISLPGRLTKQFQYLEKHWETDFIGGAVEWFGDSEHKIEYPPLSPDYLKSALFFKNKVLQPTIMFRKKSFEKYGLSWLPEWENMGDSELWFRTKQKGLRIENMKDVLIRYRKSSTQIGSRNITDREEKLLLFLRLRLNTIGQTFQAEDEQILFRFIRTKIEINKEDFERLKDLLHRIEVTNNKKKIYERHPFKAALLFYQIRLGKYYFLHTRRSHLQYFSYLAARFFHAGIRASVLFFRNEVIFR